jgi:hypothetical protein
MMQTYQNRYCVVVAGGVAGAGGASAAGGAGASAEGGVAGAGANGSDVAGAELSVTAGVVDVPLQLKESAKRMPSTTTKAAMIRPVEPPDWLTRTLGGSAIVCRYPVSSSRNSGSSSGTILGFCWGEAMMVLLPGLITEVQTCRPTELFPDFYWPQ